MSVQTQIFCLNANDEKFLAAKNGTPEEIEEWEDDNGPIDTVPGARVRVDKFYKATYDEYGGWLIDLSKIPVGVTHIKIERG